MKVIEEIVIQGENAGFLTVFCLKSHNLSNIYIFIWNYF